MAIPGISAAAAVLLLAQLGAAQLTGAPPQMIEAAEPQVSDDARRAGHHGEVLVAGIVTAEGELHDARISQSSRSPALDQAALAAAAATRFAPARDSDGQVVPQAVLIPYRFGRFLSNEPGGGLVRYRCGEFAVDMAWWQATFPERRVNDHELFRLVLGLSILAERPRDPAALRETVQGLERQWAAAMETCGRRPEQRFADALGRVGRLIDRAADQARPMPRRR